MPTLRILLDECLDRRLRKEFSAYAAKTVPEIGWAGLKNGVLLARAEKSFDVFVTVDRNLAFQQHTSKFKIAIIVLHAPSNRVDDLRPLVPRALKVMTTMRAGQVVHVS